MCYNGAAIIYTWLCGSIMYTSIATMNCCFRRVDVRVYACLIHGVCISVDPEDTSDQDLGKDVHSTIKCIPA